MLSYLRKSRKSIVDSGQTRKYLLYAIGEIILVVIGILIALQINNWNVDEKAKEQERILLIEMSKNLKQDLSFINNQLAEIELRKNKVKVLSKLLKNDISAYHDSLLVYFGAVYGVELTSINTAIYEDLKSRGFGLIKEDSLRSKINQYFEKARNRVHLYALSEESVNQELKPYYLANFQNIQFRESAKPVDIRGIFEDVLYQNLVDYRLVNFEYNQLIHHPWFIKEIQDLILSIDAYLDEKI